MEHFIHNLEGSLKLIATLVKFLLEGLGIFTVLFGVIINGRQALFLLIHPNIYAYLRIRARLGRALALALEFQLGADILATVVDPTYEDLGRLGAIAVIRTFLNYFLAKELEELRQEEQQQTSEHSDHSPRLS